MFIFNSNNFPFLDSVLENTIVYGRHDTILGVMNALGTSRKLKDLPLYTGGYTNIKNAIRTGHNRLTVFDSAPVTSIRFEPSDFYVEKTEAGCSIGIFDDCLPHLNNLYRITAAEGEICNDMWLLEKNKRAFFSVHGVYF